MGSVGKAAQKRSPSAMIARFHSSWFGCPGVARGGGAGVGDGEMGGVTP